METYVKELCANISKLNKLRSELMETTIDREYFITMVESTLEEISKQKCEYKRRNNKYLAKSNKEFPKNFDYWFNKYYDDVLTISSISYIYKEYKFSVQPLVGSYIRLNGLKPKQTHMEEDLKLQKRYISVPIGLDVDFENYGIEPFDTREVYNTGIAKNQNQLEYLLFNYRADEITNKIIHVTFGTPEEPAIIDINKLKLTRKSGVKFNISFENSYAIIFSPRNVDYYYLANNDFNEKEITFAPSNIKIIDFKLSGDSVLAVLEPIVHSIYKSGSESDKNDNDILSLLLFHENDNEGIITLAELEQQIYDFEGILLDIKIKNDDRPKDKIMVKSYPYKKPLPKGFELDDLMKRLQLMGLDV